MNTGFASPDDYQLNLVRLGVRGLEAFLGAYVEVCGEKNDSGFGMLALAETLVEDPVVEYMESFAQTMLGGSSGSEDVEMGVGDIEMEDDEEYSEDENEVEYEDADAGAEGSELNEEEDEEDDDLEQQLLAAMQEDQAASSDDEDSSESRSSFGDPSQTEVDFAPFASIADEIAMLGESVGGMEINVSEDFAKTMEMLDNMELPDQIAVLKRNGDTVVRGHI